MQVMDQNFGSEARRQLNLCFNWIIVEKVNPTRIHTLYESVHSGCTTNGITEKFRSGNFRLRFSGLGAILLRLQFRSYRMSWQMLCYERNQKSPALQGRRSRGDLWPGDAGARHAINNKT